MILETNLHRPEFYNGSPRGELVRFANPNGMNGGWFDKQFRSIKKDLSIKNIIKVAPLVASASALIPKGAITRGISFLENSKAGQAVRFLENSKANTFLKDLSQTKVGSTVTNFVKTQGVPVATDYVKGLLTPQQKETVVQLQAAYTPPTENVTEPTLIRVGTTSPTLARVGTTSPTSTGAGAKDEDNTLLYVAGGAGVLVLAYLAFK
jgi:hypothetical protein